MSALPEIYVAPIDFAVRRIYQATFHAPYRQQWKYLGNFVRQCPDAFEVALFGAGMIEGQVTVQGVPASQKVVALSRGDLRIRGVAQSDEVTGRWRIYPLVAQRPYAVVSTDPKIRFNADIADGVTPVLWEDAP